MKRLTFIHNGNDMFIKPLYERLHEWFDIGVVKPKTERDMIIAMYNSDIAWFEWCDDLVALASATKMPCKSVCRLHSYETFTKSPAQTNWNYVDKVIFVSEFIRQRCLTKFEIPHDKTTVIHNGVDLDKFTIPKDKGYNKRIAIVGYMNYKKGPMLMLQTLSAIHKYDPEFTFHYVGTFQDERVVLYWEHYLANAPFEVEMTDWIDDIPGFLADKDYILNTSMLEACPCSVMEAMACGLIPIIHRWPGAIDLFPDDKLFATPSEACSIIKSFECWFGDRDEEIPIGRMRQHIIDNYSITGQIEAIKDTLMEVLA